MAKKTKKLTEDALVNEMQPQQAPVAQQATPEEMAQAQQPTENVDPNMNTMPVEDNPADAVDPMEQAAMDQTITSDEMSPTNPADINTPPFPGAVAIGWTTPDKLGKAVAQATGDPEVASIAPDVAPSVTGDELVDADDANPVQSDIVANADSANQLPQDMNQLSPEEQDVIVEYRKYKLANMNKLVEEADDDSTDPITGLVFATEPTKAEENNSDVENTDDTDDVDDTEIEALLDDNDVESTDDVDNDFPDDTDTENEIEVDASVMDAIKDFLDDFDDDDADIPDVLRDTADFLDDLLGADSDNDDLTDVESEDDIDDVVDIDDEVEVEEIPEGDVDSDVGDDEEVDLEETDEDEELDESANPFETAHSWRQQRESVGPMSSIKNSMENTMYQEPLNSRTPVNTPPEYSNIKWPAGSGPNGSVSPQANTGLGFQESKNIRPRRSYVNPVTGKVSTPKLKEHRDGKLTDSYKRSSMRRREAMREYRNSLRESTPTPVSERSNPRFKEALNSGTRINTTPVKKDPRSWSSNRFIEKYEESSKLDFQKLLEDGFLG